MATVRDVMSRELISVDPSTTVAEAATIMGGKHVGSALVMDGDALAGIFTERDIVRALGEHFDAAGHPVSNWMTSRPITIGPDETTDVAQAYLDVVYRFLGEERVQRFIEEEKRGIMRRLFG